MGEHEMPGPSGSTIGAARPERGVTGPAAGIGAFSIWALFPIYFNQFGTDVSPWEILLHRMIWASAFLVVIVVLTRRLDRVRSLIERPKAVMALAGSALAISANWGTFIWAVNHGQILQSSLGYYINPLFNVFLGYCFLGERLSPLQRLAVGIAAAGVLISLIGYGQIPWLALILATSFGMYGLIRKQVDIDSVTGLMIETVLLLPIAAGWLLSMHLRDQSIFLRAGLSVNLLLIGSGFITILPLMLFATAARRLKLATLGILQYIAPTGHFLIGVFLYGEVFSTADAVTFGCIWVGLALYTTDIWVQHHKLLALKSPANARSSCLSDDFRVSSTHTRQSVSSTHTRQDMTNRKGQFFMKKRLRIECPNCSAVLSFEEKDVPPGKVVAADCPQCDWTQIFTIEQVQDALKNPGPAKGMFKAYWDYKD